MGIHAHSSALANLGHKVGPHRASVTRQGSLRVAQPDAAPDTLSALLSGLVVSFAARVGAVSENDFVSGCQSDMPKVGKARSLMSCNSRAC
jgi:hypothetical protein